MEKISKSWYFPLFVEKSCFGLFWPPKLSRTLPTVVFVCSGVAPGCFRVFPSVLEKKSTKYGKNPQKVDIFHFLWKNHILAYFDPLSYPEPPQGGFCVFWGCPWVFPNFFSCLTSHFQDLERGSLRGLPSNFEVKILKIDFFRPIFVFQKWPKSLIFMKDNLKTSTWGLCTNFSRPFMARLTWYLNMFQF